MTVTLFEGDCLETLKTLPDCFVQTVVTSPPYYKLRKYGTKYKVWDGDNICLHKWEKHIQKSEGGKNLLNNMPNTGNNTIQQKIDNPRFGVESDFCLLCGAWKGELGLEPNPDLYIKHLVDIFQEVHRVLTNDGTLWINIGDKFNGSGGEHKDGKGQNGLGVKNRGRIEIIQSTQVKGLKPKDLIGLPWMLAFALRADGWYLRSDIIWYKPNPQPESVKDRPTKSYEHIFLLTKNAKYYYNADAIAEIATGYDGRKNTMMKGSNKYKNGFVPNENAQSIHVRGHERWKFVDVMKFGKTGEKHSGYNNLDGSLRVNFKNGVPIRNKRDVWIINTKSSRKKHYAMFPPELPRLCILAGSKDGDTILDPFNGSGTTGEVAISLGRNYIGCELNPEYIEITKQRLSQVQLILNPNYNNT